MAVAQNRKEKIGYLPVYCYQCQEGAAHNIYRLMSFKRGLFRRSKEVQFGHVAECPRCGLFVPTSDEEAVVCLSESPVLIQETARNLFGEENVIEYWDTELENIKLGLASEVRRLEAITNVYAAVSDHLALPKDVSRNKRMNLWGKFAIWAIGMFAVVGFSLFMIPGGEEYWKKVLFVTPVIGIVWSAIWFGKSMDPNAVNEVDIRSRLKEAKNRLAQGLHAIEPTGHELQRVTEFAAEQRMWSAMVDPHDVLMQIKRIKSNGRSEANAAA